MPKQSMSTPSSFPLRRLYTFSEGFIWTSLLQNEAVRRLRVQFHCTWHAHLTSWQSTAWALYDIHRTGSFCHQTIPSKGSWLDFQSCWTSVVLADFSARCKSSARAQQLNVRLAAWHPEIFCGTGRSTVGLMLAWDRLFHYAGRKKHSCSVAKQAIDGGNAAVAQKMWCKLRQSSLQQAQWTPSGYIHGYMCYALELHMLTIPIYFFLL